MIILGSHSPRRIELLKSITKEFEIIEPLFDEKKISKDVEHYALSEAENKAISIKNLVKSEDFLICCDTIVVYDKTIYGKPKDIKDAKDTLMFLKGKTHKVITGYVIYHDGKMIKNEVTSLVVFNDLDEKTIDEYITRFDILDKAGSYGIQYNDEIPLVNRIEGSLTNVIGFPVDEIKRDLILLKAL